MRFVAIIVARHSLMIAHFPRPRRPLENYVLPWTLTICAEQKFQPPKVATLRIRGSNKLICAEQCDN